MKPSPDDTGRTSTPAGAAEVLSSTKEPPSIEVDASVARAFADDNWMARTSRAIAQTDLGMLAGYRIERVVARGAQGVVYEAKEPRTGRRVDTILQLRLHPSVLALAERIRAAGDRAHDVELCYVTPRGRWYHRSWKGDVAKSGGVATNIGVHFFDMLGFVFGKVGLSVLHHADAERAAGYLEVGRARVSFRRLGARES